MASPTKTILSDASKKLLVRKGAPGQSSCATERLYRRPLVMALETLQSVAMVEPRCRKHGEFTHLEIRCW